MASLISVLLCQYSEDWKEAATNVLKAGKVLHWNSKLSSEEAVAAAAQSVKASLVKVPQIGAPELM